MIQPTHETFVTTTLPLAELIFASPEWLVPSIIIGLVLTSLTWWNYSRSGGLKKPTAWIGLSLKIISVALLAICLLEPMQRAERPRPRANWLPILIDTSASMELKMARAETSWRERADATFDPESPTLAGYARDFDTRIYGFDRRLVTANDSESLPRGGRSSRLLDSLGELNERLKDRPVAGVLLVSDGNVDGETTLPSDLSELSFPVYPVVPDASPSMNDLSITSTSVRQTDFEISPVSVTANFTTTGAFTGSVTARLVDLSDQTTVEENKIDLLAGRTTHQAQFQFRPRDVGLGFFRLDVFREQDRQAFETPSLGTQSSETQSSLIDVASSETTLVNNRRLIAVNRRAGPYRVLYVAGRPNWEFKFLRRAIAEDAEVELTGLIRMANKEPKFSFRDKAVSSTNPLFQGLGDDAEETAEQYDEPVMIRLGVKESQELASGFPKTKDELFAFDALMIDDIEPEFFSQDQLTMIRQFVSSRGGGLMMLGGQEMFAGRAFSDSVLGDLSPVYVRAGAQLRAGKFSFALTREGLLQPWMRLRDQSDDELKRLRQMPTFTSINPVSGLKPGAYQLATVRRSGGDSDGESEDGFESDGSAQSTSLPAVVVQRFGRGKVGAVTIADLWRWSMNRSPQSEDDPSQMWRQINRWLVSDVPRRIELTQTSPDDDTGKREFRIEVRDESFQAMDNATVKISVEMPDGTDRDINAKPDADSPGVYRGSYYTDEAGSYRVRVEVTAADGQLIGSAEAGWTIQAAGNEFDRLAVNTTLLSDLAKRTGGEIIKESQLDRFATKLNSTKVPVMETWVYPIWHRGWVIFAALACLCGEWTLRRMRGLS